MVKWNPRIRKVDGEHHRNFLRIAYNHAWTYSVDKATKTGAIIVPHGARLESEVLARGANHFPDELNPTEEQIEDRVWVRQNIMHAEPSVIKDAKNKKVDTRKKKMYMPWIPCAPCADSIVEAGITTLIGHEAMIMKTPEHWWDSCGDAIDVLKKGGVDFGMYVGKIGGCKGLFREEVWHP